MALILDSSVVVSSTLLLARHPHLLGATLIKRPLVEPAIQRLYLKTAARQQVLKLPGPDIAQGVAPPLGAPYQPGCGNQPGLFILC